KRNPLGFFSPEELIFISAQEMVYLAEKEVTIFSGNTKLWQKNDFITAQKISINHKETQLHAQGEVKSFFHHKIKNQEELIKIYAAKMEFSQKEKLITYQGNNSLFAKNLKVSAKTIKLLLEKEKSGIEKIIAQQEATIEYSQYRATGGKAEYNLNQEKIILTENPVIIDQNKGRTEGKKLTFHLADDRIVMESEENKRAVTVLSSKTIKEK
ncbi:MAG: LptA/OstA family protein, partial [Candidatus Aminicenantia bacterium]